MVERLGENAGFMYLKVSAIVNEEIQSTFNGASSSSPLGIRMKWDGDLASRRGQHL